SQSAMLKRPKDNRSRCEIIDLREQSSLEDSDNEMLSLKQMITSSCTTAFAVKEFNQFSNLGMPVPQHILYSCMLLHRPPSPNPVHFLPRGNRRHCRSTGGIHSFIPVLTA
ncbi:unnamed protein product, partial [Ceratitis capitata]